MADVLPMGEEYEGFCRDESRTQGTASSISFPTTEGEVRALMRRMAAAGTPVTVQGARTGLAAGAVPRGGHVMSLSRMDRVLGMRSDRDAEGRARYYVRAQPGVVLANLRKYLADKSMPTAGWGKGDRKAWEELCAGPAQIFPTDPTETSACLGGIVACNASGARSYAYGPARPHITALRVVLADGDTLALRRGEVRAQGRRLDLETERGRRYELALPAYRMPCAKNASGYYAADDMDAIDLFIGPDGTLGIVTEVELALTPAPPVVWGASCFFEAEGPALDFVEAARPELPCALAFEYFDGSALKILRRQKAAGPGFASLPDVDPLAQACVYVELGCPDEEAALAALERLGALLAQNGGDERETWVARTDVDRERLRFFRHAVPESVNMLIDERRRTDPGITKLGSDMAVPDGCLHEVMALYRRTLAEAGLESATWGHIGDNHLHVNVLPRSAAEHARGKELFCGWAAEVTRMGGAVSAEHGVGKLKRDFLEIMYGAEHVRQMARLKLALDPQGLLGRGNLFSEQILDEERGHLQTGEKCGAGAVAGAGEKGAAMGGAGAAGGDGADGEVA